MKYDVKVLNEQGVWSTDTTAAGKTRAQDRAKFLTPRVPAVKVEDQRGNRVYLEGS